MSQFQESMICAGCGAEITWSPVNKQDRLYCCEDCSNGLPCDCATRQEWDDENPTIASTSSEQIL